MNRRGLLVFGLALGLCVPAAAHAQSFRDLAEQVAKAAQNRDRGGGPQRGRDQDNRRNDERDRQPEPPGRGQPDRAPARLVPLNQVIAQIKRSTPGELLDASGPSGGERPIYTVRWRANNGQRIDFVVDAQSGRIIGRNGG